MERECMSEKPAVAITRCSPGRAGEVKVKVKVKVKVILRPTVSQSWCQAPIWDPRPIFPFLPVNSFRQLRVC
jgi:hypothetical protein